GRFAILRCIHDNPSLPLDVSRSFPRMLARTRPASKREAGPRPAIVIHREGAKDAKKKLL
ncbi:MAG TPA: hypothetical protein VF276_16945, partial [Chloroflexia bacterium]